MRKIFLGRKKTREKKVRKVEENYVKTFVRLHIFIYQRMHALIYDVICKDIRYYILWNRNRILNIEITVTINKYLVFQKLSKKLKCDSKRSIGLKDMRFADKYI